MIRPAQIETLAPGVSSCRSSARSDRSRPEGARVAR